MHLNLDPRWKGDTNFMPVKAGTRLFSQALDETYEALLAALARGS
jgi:ATP adenylyltransferase